MSPEAPSTLSTVLRCVNVIEKLSGLRYMQSSNDASFHFERCHSLPSKICFQHTLGSLSIEVPTSPVLDPVFSFRRKCFHPGVWCHSSPLNKTSTAGSLRS